MRLGSSIAAIAIGIALLLPSLTSAAKPVRTPIEELFQITGITINDLGSSVLVTINVENISLSTTAGIWSGISDAYLCPDNGGSGTMTPIFDCTNVATALNAEGTSSIEDGGIGTVEIEFLMSIEPGMDYVFFTQVVCASGRGFRCDGYLHSFFGLDQVVPMP